jgi:hypothetical protein
MPGHPGTSNGRCTLLSCHAIRKEPNFYGTMNTKGNHITVICKINGEEEAAVLN